MHMTQHCIPQATIRMTSKAGIVIGCWAGMLWAYFATFLLESDGIHVRKLDFKRARDRRCRHKTAHLVKRERDHIVTAALACAETVSLTRVIDHICRHHPVALLKLLMQHSLNSSSPDVHNIIIKFDVVPTVLQLSVKGCKIACKHRTVP